MAVNARQANLLLQVSPASKPVGSSDGALHLFAWHYDSLSPRAELGALMKEYFDGTDLPANTNDPEQLYALERRLVEERRVLPLVLWPEYVGIRANVHNWNASAWGEWRLADVWLESDDSNSPASAPSPPSNPSKIRNPGARP